MRKGKWIIPALCTLALISNSVTILAQDQSGKKEEKKNVFIFRDDDGMKIELPHIESWVGERGDFFNGFGFFNGQAGAPTVEFISHEFSFDSKSVKNAPYSADAIRESIQTLGDGNRIVRRSTSRVYRDSEGRTRQEQELKAVGPWKVSGEPQRMIFINDPVAGAHYNLNPQKKSARRMAISRFISENDGNNMSISISGKNKSASATVAGKGDVRFVTDDNRTIVLSGTGSDEKVLAEVRSKIGGTPAGIGTGRRGVFVSGGDIKAFESDRVKREDLGKQIMEGVEVEGTRTTITIPAGEIDNELPIAIVSERWFSPELQVVVMTKNSDPRTGVSTYRLTNINRAEPEAALFQVPSDFTVEESGSFDIRVRALEKKLQDEKRQYEEKKLREKIRQQEN